MSGHANKELVRKFFETVLNETRPDAAATAAAALVLDGFVIHHPLLGGGSGDAMVAMTIARHFREAFPDLRYTLEDLVAENDKVATRWIATGTHRGPLNGIAPTGRVVTVAGADLFLFDGRRIREIWVNSDVFGLMQQIGAIATPSPPA